jgi:hypothetical protein
MKKDLEVFAIPKKANIVISLPDIHVPANTEWILPRKSYGTKPHPICHLKIGNGATIILQRETYVNHLEKGNNVKVEPDNYLHVLIDTTEISITGKNSVMEDSN